MQIHSSTILYYSLIPITFIPGTKQKGSHKGEAVPHFTPMFQQYLSIKADYQDCILFYRLGDFYEMFFDDAEQASEVLDIRLTNRECGMNQRAPMCGIPYHSYEGYLAKLIDKGYKVAICEQTTPPDPKGIVKREVVRVVTKGTITESSMLTTDNNYLCSVYGDDSDLTQIGSYGVAWVDITTSEFCYHFCATQDNLLDLLTRIKPKEIICNNFVFAKSLDFDIIKRGDCVRFSRFYEHAFTQEFAIKIITTTLGVSRIQDLSKDLFVLIAIGGLLEYINHTQKKNLQTFGDIQNDSDTDILYINKNARRTLEIDANTRDGNTRGTLYSVVNYTNTDMGQRLLKKWLNAPSTNIDTIQKRQEVVKILNLSLMLRDNLTKELSQIKDIERLALRISNRTIKPDELLTLLSSLNILPKVKTTLIEYSTEPTNEFANNILSFNDATTLLDRAIHKEPSNLVRAGGVIADGYHKSLDSLRNIKLNATNIVANIEQKERQVTNIKNLKVMFNRVHGYFVEVPKSQVNMVPYRYQRKATTTNSERYITEELKEIEKKVLGADEEIIQLEQQLYDELLQKLDAFVNEILIVSKTIAYLDTLCSFAILATNHNYNRPLVVDTDTDIIIKDGRHPVAERLSGIDFVPNDTHIDSTARTIIITGPNMSGKSVYMRQVALIVILAQCGCFVPATSCKIGLVDRIFTRVGAGDDLLSGQSTFMVEMSEVADITNNLTNRSLLLLDEVGRGTATYDGLSIAWAIVEYLATKTQSRTLFSTHYHELTHLQEILPHCVNYKMAVKEVGENIIFLRKLLKGSVNKSFGIEVAKLSGLPSGILQRAKQILSSLEQKDLTASSNILPNNTNNQQHKNNNEQIAFILKKLKSINPDDITPRNAYDILCELAEKVK